MKCPSCGEKIVKAATEGGTLMRPRYVRVTPEGRLLLACQHCRAEIERLPAGKLVLFRAYRRVD